MKKMGRRNPEFTMLEWVSPALHYVPLMNEGVDDLLQQAGL